MLRGTVFLDDRGRVPRWIVRYPDVNGRWKRETTAVSSRQLARRILAQRNDEVAQARLLHLPNVDALTKPKSPVTVREYAQQYLAHVEANLGAAALKRNRAIWRTQAEKEFGRKTLRELTPGDLQKFITRRRREGKKPSTVRTEIAFMSGLLREAMKEELIDRNVARLVAWPKVESTIVRWLTEKEEATLLEFAPRWIRPAIIISVNSGLRDGELRKLTWADVSFEQGTLTIRHTKSKKDRVVPMNATLRQTLAELPRKIDCPSVLVSPRSGKAYDHFGNNGWRRTLKRSGIKHLRWHDLRHTFASRLAQRGVSLQVIKELLGHSTMQMVLRYAHLQQQNLVDAVAALDPHAEAPIRAPAATS